MPNFLSCSVLGGGKEEDNYNKDVSYRADKGKYATGAARHHAALLKEVYKRAPRKDITSTTLILDQVKYLLSITVGPWKACVLLSEAVASSATKDVDKARLCLL